MFSDNSYNDLTGGELVYQRESDLEYGKSLGDCFDRPTTYAFPIVLALSKGEPFEIYYLEGNCTYCHVTGAFLEVPWAKYDRLINFYSGGKVSPVVSVEQKTDLWHPMLHSVIFQGPCMENIGRLNKGLNGFFFAEDGHAHDCRLYTLEGDFLDRCHMSAKD